MGTSGELAAESAGQTNRPSGQNLEQSAGRSAVSDVARPAAELNARYGRGGRSRKPVLIGAVSVVVLAGLAWLIWVAWVQSNPPVSSQLQGFEIVSPTSVKATMKVDRNKSVEATCRLQAKSADFSIVGEVTVTVPADSARHQVLPVTLTTQRSATSVVLVGCTTADQHRPR